MTPDIPATVPIHGGQLRQIAARFQMRVEDLLDFSANINPAGPPRSVLQALQHALSDPATLTSYPDLELMALKHALADTSQIRTTNLSIANGFAPLLGAALRSLRVERCLLPVPSFGEYRRTLENAGAIVIPFHLPMETNFQYDPDALLQSCREHRCDAVLLANPQNPSGVAATAEQMNNLIRTAEQHGITTLLDEAFIDFCPDRSVDAICSRAPSSRVPLCHQVLCDSRPSCGLRCQ